MNFTLKEGAVRERPENPPGERFVCTALSTVAVEARAGTQKAAYRKAMKALRLAAIAGLLGGLLILTGCPSHDLRPAAAFPGISRYWFSGMGG